MKQQLLTIVAFGVLCLASAGVSLADESGDPLFRDTTVIDVTLTAPLHTLVRLRPQDTYVRGQMSFLQADGSEASFKVKVRTRGNFRHKNCKFPPFLLNFRKKKVNGTLLDGQNKLKLVVHCDDAVRYEQAVLREYLAYRILNVLTDDSFRARLLRVRYVDSDGRRKEEIRYAFLIENKKRLAKRIGLPEIQVAKASVESLHGETLNLTSVYQFLIGNTDFSPLAGPPEKGCCHNYVLFGTAGDPVKAIPYDFDQAGLVEAPYAMPNKRFRLRSVSDRLYRGRCRNNEYLGDSLRRLHERRTDLYALVDQIEGFTPTARRRVTSYIDDFYRVIDNPKGVERRLVQKCI